MISPLFYYEVNTTRYVRGTVPFSVKKDNLLYYNEIGPPAESNSKGGCHMNDTKSLSHTSYRCKYHIVIVPKYRRMIIYNKLRADMGQILRSLIERKPGCVLLEAEACPDHIHMLIEIPPKYSVSEFMGYLKSKSTLMIFERHANMKYKFGNRKFWARGYFVDTVGKNEKAIREYIQNQLAEDKLADELNMKEYIDPFTGEKVKTSDLPRLF